jgi:hypothetical protein
LRDGLGSRFWLAFTGRRVLGDTLPDPKISYPLEFIQHLESHNVFPLFSIFLIYLFIHLTSHPNVSFDDVIVLYRNHINNKDKNIFLKKIRTKNIKIKLSLK